MITIKEFILKEIIIKNTISIREINYSNPINNLIDFGYSTNIRTKIKHH